MKTYTKDPNSTLDYSWDWTAWLAGDTIVTSQWLVPAALRKTQDSNDTTSTTVWLKGGPLGQTYEVTNRITTAAGRVDERSFKLAIANR
jgi:hypothetical protein